MMAVRLQLLVVILGFGSCTNALVQVVRSDLDSTDRSGNFVPSGLDAKTISLLQYLEDEEATETGNAPEVLAGRGNVDLAPVSLFPVAPSLFSRFQGKRDRSYIGRRSGRRLGRTFIGRRKRNSAFDGWGDSAENDREGRDGIADGLETEELAENKWSGLRSVGSEVKNVGTFMEEREEGKPWHVDFKRARSFIGKRENPLEVYVSEQPNDIDQKSKRARSYIGKRNIGAEEEERTSDIAARLTPTTLEEKRARSFIGKRMDNEYGHKRGRSFIGKRQESQWKQRRALIRKREVNSDETRGRSFIGKRYTEIPDKRARSFIGKREDFESDDKRSRSFVGKREDFESEDKRARSFIGKRGDFDSEDKRARSFIGKRGDFDSEDKRARSFIGKRGDFDSGDKRARSFIGRRSNERSKIVIDRLLPGLTNNTDTDDNLDYGSTEGSQVQATDDRSNLKDAKIDISRNELTANHKEQKPPLNKVLNKES